MLELIKGLIEDARAGLLMAHKRERNSRGGFLLWLNRLILLTLAGFFVARWLRDRQEQAGPRVEVEEEGIQLDRFVPDMEVTRSSKPDDLAVLEGIGPKISSVLQEAGIKTYRQLAETDMSRLQEILREANLRLADPGTWPEQARLLDAGRQEDFQKLIDHLKAGRRT